MNSNDEWAGIEARLRREGDGPEFTEALRGRILRAVRDDRAAASVAAPPRRTPAWMWLAAGAAAALAVAVLRPAPAPSAAPAPAAARESYLPDVAAMARAPLQVESVRLQADLRNAAGFLLDCLPAAPGA